MFKYKVKIYSEENVIFELFIEKENDEAVEDYLFNHPVWSGSVASYQLDTEAMQ